MPVGNHAIAQAERAGLDLFMALANPYANRPIRAQIVEEFIAVALEKHEQRGLASAARIAVKYLNTRKVQRQFGGRRSKGTGI